ncbi:DUF3710 domain-containing protein [Pseudonocardia sp. C8]|uniref:DUF3710 domain-containing protein n=1 Tax=Pseudonocardia sp. C8 TaxID=2762759 RepID=UPI001643136E|nr:DUF3710 domain-containing protein [Pseudonocardia sp. C8]MBC3191557.1 DUF3710 domain-containing protein [Pseudonocardia sp. C8]
MPGRTRGKMFDIRPEHDEAEVAGSGAYPGYPGYGDADVDPYDGDPYAADPYAADPYSADPYDEYDDADEPDGRGVNGRRANGRNANGTAAEGAPNRNGTGRNGTGRNGAGRNGAGRNETDRNRADRNETGRNGPGRNETGRNGAGRNGAGRNGTGHTGRMPAGGGATGRDATSTGRTGVGRTGRNGAPRGAAEATGGAAATTAVRAVNGPAPAAGASGRFRPGDDRDGRVAPDGRWDDVEPPLLSHRSDAEEPAYARERIPQGFDGGDPDDPDWGHGTPDDDHDDEYYEDGYDEDEYGVGDAPLSVPPPGSGGRPLGPADVEELDPSMTDALARVDLGAIQVPVPYGAEMKLEPADAERTQAVHLLLPEGRIAVSALAAPRSTGLWGDLSAEIEQSLRNGGARVRSVRGDWGRELHARTESAASVFVGCDGPRWMVYGVATASLETVEALDVELRRVLRGIIVVRGKSPYPPRTVLPLELPEHLRQKQPESAAAQKPSITVSVPRPADTAATGSAPAQTKGSARPAGATPARSTGATPAQPTGATPVQHSGATPAQATGATPAPHTGATPAQHAGAMPAQATGATPAQPTGAAQPRPGGTTKARRTGATPAQPTGAPPAPGTGTFPATPSPGPRDDARPAAGPAPSRRMPAPGPVSAPIRRPAPDDLRPDPDDYTADPAPRAPRPAPRRGATGPVPAEQPAERTALARPVPPEDPAERTALARPVSPETPAERTALAGPPVPPADDPEVQDGGGPQRGGRTSGRPRPAPAAYEHPGEHADAPDRSPRRSRRTATGSGRVPATGAHPVPAGTEPAPHEPIAEPPVRRDPAVTALSATDLLAGTEVEATHRDRYGEEPSGRRARTSAGEEGSGRRDRASAGDGSGRRARVSAGDGSGRRARPAADDTHGTHADDVATFGTGAHHTSGGDRDTTAGRSSAAAAESGGRSRRRAAGGAGRIDAADLLAGHGAAGGSAGPAAPDDEPARPASMAIADIPLADIPLMDATLEPRPGSEPERETRSAAARRHAEPEPPPTAPSAPGRRRSEAPPAEPADPEAEFGSGDDWLSTEIAASRRAGRHGAGTGTSVADLLASAALDAPGSGSRRRAAEPESRSAGWEAGAESAASRTDDPSLTDDDVPSRTDGDVFRTGGDVFRTSTAGPTGPTSADEARSALQDLLRSASGYRDEQGHDTDHDTGHDTGDDSGHGTGGDPGDGHGVTGLADYRAGRSARRRSREHDRGQDDEPGADPARAAGGSGLTGQWPSARRAAGTDARDLGKHRRD